jgi:hypothetical protein
MPVTGIASARLAATAASASTGCRSDVTSWIVPPVCRLAVLRTVSSWPLGRTSSIDQPASATVSVVP